MSGEPTPDEVIDFAIRRLEQLANGPRYGVGASHDPYPLGTETVFAWFVDRDDAMAFAEPMKLPVFDLVEGKLISDWPGEFVGLRRHVCPGDKARLRRARRKGRVH